MLLAQVLLLSNVDVKGGLANGTRGVVKGIVSIRDYLHQVSPDWSATAHTLAVGSVGIQQPQYSTQTGFSQHNRSSSQLHGELKHAGLNKYEQAQGHFAIAGTKLGSCASMMISSTTGWMLTARWLVPWSVCLLVCPCVCCRRG